METTITWKWWQCDGDGDGDDGGDNCGSGGYYGDNGSVLIMVVAAIMVIAVAVWW